MKVGGAVEKKRWDSLTRKAYNRLEAHIFPRSKVGGIARLLLNVAFTTSLFPAVAVNRGVFNLLVQFISNSEAPGVE